MDEARCSMEIFAAIIAAVVLSAIAIKFLRAAGAAEAAEEKARVSELTLFAQRFEWSFDPRNDDVFWRGHIQFSLFRQGSWQKTSNTLRRTVGTRFGPMAIQAGDYEIVHHDKDTGNDYYYGSYLMATLPFSLPFGTELVVRPEFFRDKLGAMVGFEDIDFESEEFSRRYFVSSNDRKFAYAVIHPHMMEFLLASPAGLLEMQGAKALLCSSRMAGKNEKSSRWGAQKFEDALGWLEEFLRLWPDHLVADCKGPPVRAP